MANPTREQLVAALRKADAAGDVPAARAIARRIKGMEQPATPRSETDPSLWAGGVVPSTDPTEGMGAGSPLAAGAGSRLNDAWTALKQTAVDAGQFVAEGGIYGTAARAALPGLFEQNDVRSLVAGAPSRNPMDIGGRISDSLQPMDDALRADQTQRNAADAPLMDTSSGKIGYGLTAITELLAPATLLRGTRAGTALLPNTLRGNVIQGGVLGAATQPLAEGDSRAVNTAVGGGAGVAGHLVGRGLQRWGDSASGAVSKEAREVYELAKARGIELTPAQLSDSRALKWAHSMLRSVPFTGANARHQAQVGSLNRAVAGTIGEDAPQVSSAVYSAAKERQSRMFNELTARNDLRVDSDLMQALSLAASEADMAAPAVRAQVEAAIDRLASQAVTGPTGVTIPGRAYQSFDSALGQALKSGGEPAYHLGKVRTAVREAMDRSISPADAEAWRQLRQQYGNRKTLTGLVSRASDGPLPPAQLLGAVTSNRSGKEAMASGARGELGALAKIGQRMKEPPSSGTAERMMYGGAFNPVNWPGLAAGVTVGAPASRVLDSKGLAAFIMRENPGINRKRAGKAASALVKLLGVSSVPAAAGDE